MSHRLPTPRLATVGTSRFGKSDALARGQREEQAARRFEKKKSTSNTGSSEDMGARTRPGKLEFEDDVPAGCGAENDGDVTLSDKLPQPKRVTGDGVVVPKRLGGTISEVLATLRLLFGEVLRDSVAPAVGGG